LVNLDLPNQKIGGGGYRVFPDDGGVIPNVGIGCAEHSVVPPESHFWFWGGGVSGGVDNLKNDARPARPEKIKLGCRRSGDKKKPHALGGA